MSRSSDSAHLLETGPSSLVGPPALDTRPATGSTTNAGRVRSRIRPDPSGLRHERVRADLDGEAAHSRLPCPDRVSKSQPGVLFADFTHAEPNGRKNNPGRE